MDFDQNYVKDYYKKHIGKYGKDDIRGMAWFEEDEYNKRFDSVVKIGNLNNSTILDVGCGFGGLYSYLKKINTKEFSYLGLDIVPEMVDSAKNKNPEGNFKVLNILTEDIEKFDYVFCIGTLNILTDNHEVFFMSMIDRMINIANKGVAVCFLSDKDYLLDGPYYFHNPKKIKESCESRFKVNVEILENHGILGESILFIKKN